MKVKNANFCGKKSQIRNGWQNQGDFVPSNSTIRSGAQWGKFFPLTAIFCAVIAISCFGCLASTRSTVTEYDQHGRAVRTVETSESVVRSLTRSTAGKTVVAWESGWAAYIKATTATIENPVPSVKIFAGNVNRGIITTPPRAGEWQGIASAIEATKAPLQVTGTGVRNE